MKRFIIFLLSLTVIACDDVNLRPSKPEPVFAHCAPECYQPCTTEKIRWTADPNDSSAWDALVNEVTLPLIDSVKTCDVRRQACATCLNNLERRGIIR